MTGLTDIRRSIIRVTLQTGARCRVFVAGLLLLALQDDDGLGASLARLAPRQTFDLGFVGVVIVDNLDNRNLLIIGIRHLLEHWHRAICRFGCVGLRREPTDGYLRVLSLRTSADDCGSE